MIDINNYKLFDSDKFEESISFALFIKGKYLITFDEHYFKSYVLDNKN